jgi:uncharacterized membrane protein HdeD (DUF308 family)
MQKILGLIFIAIGVFGIAVYLPRAAFITTDEKIAMLLGFFMILIGVIIIYADWKKNTDRNQARNEED